MWETKRSGIRPLAQRPSSDATIFNSLFVQLLPANIGKTRFLENRVCDICAILGLFDAPGPCCRSCESRISRFEAEMRISERVRTVGNPTMGSIPINGS